MTDYVKNHATQEALESLEDLISKDARFRSLLDKLWEKAFESGFSKESGDRIKSAYLSKAKTLLPSVIKKARNDALRGLGSRNSGREIEDREDSEERVAETKSASKTSKGNSAPPSSGKYKKEVPKGMSTLDYLMKD
jgi:hypothetical protein